MTRQRVRLTAVRVTVTLVVTVADLGRGPAELQQHGGFAEEGAGSAGEGRLGDERQRGQRTDQEAVGQAGSLSLPRQPLQQAEDTQLAVQGHQLIERSTGSRGGEIRALATPQRGEHRRAILSIPDTFHQRTSPVRSILSFPQRRSCLSPIVCSCGVWLFSMLVP